MKTTLFIGAGFSKFAGIPLASELFDDKPYCPTQSKKMDLKYESVLNAWKKEKNISVEEWLRSKFLSQEKSEITFNDILDFILARIVSIPKKYGKNGAYYYGISTSIENNTHREFWSAIKSKFELNAIVTTNYDILIEQGYREEYSKGTNERKAPAVKYGGFPYYFEQKIRIMTNIATGNNPSEFREDVLDGIELFKLHGSLNWVEEPHGFKIHDDVRAVFRAKVELGKPRVIPPLEEKEKPEWAYEIWNYAKRRLSESDIWFICGYSFPEYDKAVRNLFSEASKDKSNLKIYISDPNSKNIALKLGSVLKCNYQVTTLNGLPEVLIELNA